MGSEMCIRDRILTLFGFAAGVKTMMRSARELQEKELSAQDNTEEDDIDG